MENSNQVLLDFLSVKYNLKLTKLVQVDGGYINSNYISSTESRYYFLRIYNNQFYLGQRKEEDIVFETKLISYFQANGVNIPSLVSTRSGEKYFKYGVNFGILMEKIVDLRRVKLNSLLTYSSDVGFALSEIHRVSLNMPFKPKRTWPRGDIFQHTYIRYLNEKNNLIELLSDDLVKTFEEINWDTKFDRITIHGDFYQDNIILSSNKKIYVTDWESFRFGNFYEDIACYLITPILKFVEKGNGKLLSFSDIKSFLSGYSKGKDICKSKLIVSLEVYFLLLICDFYKRFGHEKLNRFCKICSKTIELARQIDISD